MITSAYFKSSNCSMFNPILHKFYVIICEIIVSKTVSGIFLTFCRSSFIDNFIVINNFWNLKINRNLNISRPIYLKQNSVHSFEDHICTNKLEELFYVKNVFSRTWSFFRDCKTTDLDFSFFHKKIILYFLFQFLSWLFGPVTKRPD